MNLGNFMLGEKSQSKKMTYYVTLFVRYVQNRQIQGQKVNQWLLRAGVGRQGLIANSDKCSKIDCGEDYTTL